MPRPRKYTQSDMFSLLSQELRTSAVRPNINGYVPHQKQELFHTSPARGRLFIGGNRSGKTVGGGVELVNKMRGIDRFKPIKHEPPIATRAVGVDFDHGVAKIMVPEIARWLPPSALRNGSWEDSYDRQLKTLTLENGSTCEFMSYEQDIEKFAGTSRHYTWFDEEPPKDIYDECMMRLIDVSGDWWITMTPVEGMTWTYDTIYIAARTNPDLFVVEVVTDENPHINSVEIDVLQAGLSAEDKKARRLGQYVAISGLIYKMIGEQHFVETFMPPRDWLHFSMMDHGLSNPTCFLWAAVNNDGWTVVYDEHYFAGEVVGWHAARVHEKNAEHNRVPDYYVGDPSIRAIDAITGTSIQIEYMDHDIPIVLGNNDVSAGINAVTQRLIGIQNRPQLVICTDKCPMLTWEIQRYRWAVWASKRMAFDKNKKEDPHKKDDHACDALRYGISSRPLTDSGQEIPEFFPPDRAFHAQSAYTELVATVPPGPAKTYSDYNLGDEY